MRMYVFSSECISCTFALPPPYLFVLSNSVAVFIFLLLLPICFLMRERNKGCAFGFVKRRRGGGGRSWGSRTVARIFCMNEIYFK